MRNRHRQEIHRDIVSICKDGAILTHVMYRGYVSYAQAKECLDYLSSTGLLQLDPLTRQYHATAKGNTLLEATQTMSELLPIAASKLKSDQWWPVDGISTS